MTVLRFACPTCGASLKVRDERELQEPVPCPECQQWLLASIDPQGMIRPQKVASPPSVAVAPVPPQTPPPPLAKTPVLLAKKLTPTGEPVTLEPPEVQPVFPWQMWAAMVVGILLVGSIPWLLPLSDSVSPPADQHEAEQASNTSEKNSEVEKKAEGTTSPPTVKVPSPPPQTPISLEGRLKALGQRVITRELKDGHFPSGAVAGNLPAAERLSWLAELAQETAPASVPKPRWEQAWKGTAQEGFIRRSLPEFLNPQLDQLVSDDGYPATHFVGVSGVGADAAHLSVDHPRAGIFGDDRKTRRADVKDGLSNTILLAGVEKHFGAWAAAGPATYRPFTRAPYVHGPDGFGTGQPNSMLVLMADGSVRTISRDTDPKVVRRLAAMADGLTLDPTQGGDPGDPPVAVVPPLPEKTTPPMPETKPATPSEPLDKPVEEVPLPPIDIAARLKRKVLKFDQAKPAPAYKVLLQIEELAAVRIEYDRAALGAAAERLETPVKLTRSNVTLGELLDEVLKAANLSHTIEHRMIRITAP